MEDWTGIELVQVKAKDLAKLHHELSGLRKKNTELQEKLNTFSTLGLTQQEVKLRLKEFHSIIADKNKLLKDLHWSKEQAEKLHAAEKRKVATLEKEILKLKAMIFDKKFGTPDEEST